MRRFTSKCIVSSSGRKQARLLKPSVASLVTKPRLLTTEPTRLRLSAISTPPQLQHERRAFSSKWQHILGPWRDLPVAQRQAWEVLGWTEESWDGRKSAPISAMKAWEELSSTEQSAATHGLGYNRETWDAELEKASLDNLVASSSSPSSASSPATSRPATQDNGMLQKAWDLGMKAVPFVKVAVALSPKLKRSAIGAFFETAVDVATDLHETVKEPTIVNGTEDIAYLDDSGSMSFKLSKAQDLWAQMARKLQANPTRIVKFGTSKTVLVPRREASPASSVTDLAISASWNATSGSTYLWHMILWDIQANYKPGSGRLRVFVITDGSDTDSPAPYNGMEGMNPMMRDLKAKGFDIEFHIVFVSSKIAGALDSFFGYADRLDVKRYEDLALATGGGFLHLTDLASDQVDRFLARIGDGRQDEKMRLEAKQAYEERVRTGRSAKFDWYVKLPPR